MSEKKKVTPVEAVKEKKQEIPFGDIVLAVSEYFKGENEHKLVIAKLELERKQVKDSLTLKAESANLETLNILDKRDKRFKGIMLGICIVGLVLSVVFDDNGRIIPVISIIVGLLLNNSSILDFANFHKQKRTDHNKSDGDQEAT